MRRTQVVGEVLRRSRSARSAAVGNAVGATVGDSGRGAADVGASAADAAIGAAARGARSAAAARQDPALQRRGRLDERDRCVEHRQDGGQLVDLGVRLIAGREMGADGLGLGRLERVEDEPGREVADVVAGERHGLARLAHVTASWPSRTRRMASRPSRIRLLTVPSGVPVRSATSTWVNPPK